VGGGGPQTFEPANGQTPVWKASAYGKSEPYTGVDRDTDVFGLTSELTRRRESKHLRRTKLVTKHAPAARVQRFVVEPP
jgi:hypothetical protein